jgi:hypothetical protein
MTMSSLLGALPRCSQAHWLSALLCALALTSCAGAAPKPASDAAASGGTPVTMVSSSVVVGSCPDSAKMNSKQAEREIEELLNPCTKVPGGAAHFSATLLPGGQVELASPSGDPNEGVVPTCLVQSMSQLRHKVKLTAPCKFDVKLEQRSATEPRAN